MKNRLIHFVLLAGLMSSPFWSLAAAFKTAIVHSESDVIWGFDFLSKDQMIFTLRSGQIKIVDLKTKAVTQLEGVPKAYTRGQAGFLDIRVSPENTKIIYLAYSKINPKDSDLSSTALWQAELAGPKLINGKDIFVGNNLGDGNIHYGARIEFSKDKHIFLSVGERNERQKAQDPKLHHGKLLRMKMDGSQPEVWTLGHRNPQGLAFHPETGDLWLTEFGPRGGDELNLIIQGKNYGWPEVTKGKEYWGPSIGVREKTGIEEPKAFWVPSISPSGSQFYSGDLFPEWKNSLFVGCLSGMHLRRITFDGQKVKDQEVLLKDLSERIRNVRGGSDGALYFSTDSGRIYQISK